MVDHDTPWSSTVLVDHYLLWWISWLEKIIWIRGGYLAFILCGGSIQFSAWKSFVLTPNFSQHHWVDIWDKCSNFRIMYSVHTTMDQHGPITGIATHMQEQVFYLSHSLHHTSYRYVMCWNKVGNQVPTHDGNTFDLHVLFVLCSLGRIIQLFTLISSFDIQLKYWLQSHVVTCTEWVSQMLCIGIRAGNFPGRSIFNSTPAVSNTDVAY